MKVQDKLFNIFTEIRKIEDLELFENITDSSLNMLYMAKHGCKTLNKFCELEPIETIANNIINLYKNKWITLYKLSLLDFKELTADKIETITESKQGNESNVSLISSFDEDSFTDDNKTNSENQTQRNYERVIKGGLQTKLNIVSYLQQDFFYTVVFKDLNEVLTLSIYD